MKIVLDENIDQNLKRFLKDYEVYHVRDMKWLGRKNGELLKLAVTNNFDVFISNDAQIKFQQNLTKFDIHLIILKTKGNDLDFVYPILPRLLEVINAIKSRVTKDKYFEI